MPTFREVREEIYFMRWEILILVIALVASAIAVVYVEPEAIFGEPPQMTCSLTTTPLFRGDRANFHLVVNSPPLEDIKFTEFVFDFDDGDTLTRKTNNETDHTFVKPGEYTVTGSIALEVNGRKTQTSTCEVTVVIPALGG